MRLFAVLSLLTVQFSPSFCQESPFRPGDCVIARDLTFLKISPRSLSHILAVLERNAPATIIDRQSPWVRVASIDSKSQGWAKANEFAIQPQPHIPDAPTESSSALTDSQGVLQEHSQTTLPVPQAQNSIKNQSEQGIGFWGIIFSSILAAVLGGSLMFFYHQKKYKQRPPTKGHGEGLRKFNELMIAFEGINTTQQKLRKSMSGNGYDEGWMLFEELGDAYQQMAALQKKSLGEIEYMQQEIAFLKEELKISQ